jgi:hypothetical protein
MRPFTIAAALSASAALSAGCVDRTISISSEPSGALVYLNDREVGRTPLTTGFTFYGTYDVRLEREGCRPLWTTARAAQPWWEYPGIDLLAELTGPKEVRVDWHFRLEPSPPPGAQSSDALLERAGRLRELNRMPTDAIDAAQAAGKLPAPPPADAPPKKP